MSFFGRLAQDITHPFGIGNAPQQARPMQGPARTPAPVQQRPQAQQISRTPAPQAVQRASALSVRPVAIPRFSAPVTVQQRPQVALQVKTAAPQQLKVGNQTIAPAANRVAGVAQPVIAPQNSIVHKPAGVARAIQTVGLGASRSLVGTGQAVSGLYDLATPGNGTNRFSKTLDQGGKNLDELQRMQGLNKTVYKGAQLAGDLASYAYGGGEAKAAGNAIGKAAPIITKVSPTIAKTFTPGLEKLAAKNLAGKAAAGTIKTLAKPGYQAGNAGYAALNLGKDASRGNDTSLKTVAENVLPGTVLPVAGVVAKAGIKAGAKATVKGVQALDNKAIQAAARNPAGQIGSVGKDVNKGGENTLYHGTAKGNVFDSFALDKQNSGVGSNELHQGKAVYLTDNKQAAGYFSKQATRNQKLKDTSLSIEQATGGPDVAGEVYNVSLAKGAKVKALDHRPTSEEVQALQRQGYHGTSFPETAFGAIEGDSKTGGIKSRTTVVFDPKHAVINKPDPLAALKQEALKYKSADEFVKSQGNTLYHGGNHPLGEFDVNKAHPSGLYGKAMYLTKDAERAKSYGSNVSELQLPKDAKLVSSKEFEKRVSEITPTVQYGDPTIARAKAVEQLKNEGYHGVREVNKQNGDTVAIFNTDKLQPKQQLTDLYNQAHAGATPAPSTKLVPPQLPSATPTTKLVTQGAGKGESLVNDIPKLPEFGTKIVPKRDLALRSTRSVIERQGEHGQQLAGMLQGARDTEEILQAQIAKQLPTVRSLKGKDFENFVEATQGKAPASSPKIEKAIGEWQAVHPQIRDRAVNPNGANLDVGDLGQNYYPHYIDYQKIFKDKNALNTAINHLVETGQATNPAEALGQLRHASDISRNRAFGNLESQRLIDLPFYDKTPNSLTNYIGGSAKRIAQAEHFGAKDEKALDLIGKAGQQGYDTEAMKNAYDVAVGAKRYGSKATSASNALRSFQSTTRLGLGALTNAGQNVNTGIVTGHMRTMTAMVKQLSPEVRSRVADTGVIADAVLNDLKTQAGFTGKVLSKITAPGFSQVEKFNRSVAATAGRDYGLRLAQKGKVDVLRRLGVTGDITGKTLTEAQQIQIARKVVEKTQFKVDPQDLPGWVDSPGGKLVAQFRTFSYSQSKFVSNEIIKPLAKGNVLPAGRLLAALPVGYALYEAKRSINGRPEETSPTKRLLATFQNVGGAGLAFDIYQGLNPPNSKYTPSDRRVSMALGTIGGPTLGLAGQTAGAVSDLIQRKNVPADESRLGGKVVVGKNDKTYTDATQAARLALGQIPIVGGPIKNRVLPYKKQSDAENGFADSKKSTPGPFEAIGQVLGKLTGQKDTSAATNSPEQAIAKVKADDKATQAKYKSTLSKSDYELSKLNNQDRQKLLNQGVVTQAKLDGLDNYVNNQKAKLGMNADKSVGKIATTDAHSKKVLQEYDNLDAKARDTKAYKEYDYDYKVAKAKYDDAKASGKIVSRADDIKAQDKVIKLKAGSGFSKDTRDFYSLTPDELYRIVSVDPKGNDIVKNVVAYGDKLVAEGVDSKNKFRTKYGLNIASKAQVAASKGSKASSRAAAKSIRVNMASAKKAKNYYTGGGKTASKNNATFKLPGGKSGKSSGSVKLASYKAPKSTTIKKPKGILV